MESRTNLLAIVRWQHQGDSFNVSWPVFGVVSSLARVSILCELICPPVVLLAMSYVQDRTLFETLWQFLSISIPSYLKLLFCLPWIVLLTDLLLRYRLYVSPEAVWLRKPWGTCEQWQHSRSTHMVLIQQEIRLSDSRRLRLGNIELVLESVDGRRRVSVGGSMNLSVARALYVELGQYVRSRN